MLASATGSVNMDEASSVINRMGIRVRVEDIPTMNPGLFLHALRLSTSNPTTRSLKEEDMAYIGLLLAKPLTQTLSPEEIEQSHQEIVALVKDSPISSEEWLGESDD